jgi:hypothetical protein
MVIVLGVILSILILNIKMAEDLRLEIMNKTMEQAIESVHPCRYLQFEAQVFVVNYPLKY